MDVTTPFQKFMDKRNGKPAISVHRGLWNPAPENSVAAISASPKFGIIEIDLQLSSDGVPMVFHDDALDRMTGTSGLLAHIGHKDLSQIPLLAADGGPDAEVTDHRIPTLAEVLEQAAPGSFFDFDIKHANEIEKIANWIFRLGGQSLGSIKVNTSSDDDIKALLSLQQRHEIMVMAKCRLPKAGIDHIAALARAGVAAAEVWFSDIDELSMACNAAGDDMAISTYTLNPVHCAGLSDAVAMNDPAKVWGQLVDAGVSIIMTDEAAKLDTYLSAIKGRSSITS